MRKCVRRVRAKSRFDKRSFRWTPKRKTKGGHVRVLIGCPKGKWNAKRERCRVGTEAYEIVTYTNRSRCPAGSRRR